MFQRYCLTLILFIFVQLNLAHADFVEYDYDLAPEDFNTSLSLLDATTRYQDIFNTIKQIYQDEINELNGQLKLNLRWKKKRVNASASRVQNDWFINFDGGMLYHRKFNEKIYLVVLCHELGHHLAGEPVKFPDNPDKNWVSSEGQSDYFAINDCLKKYLQKVNNKLFVSTPDSVESNKACAHKYFSKDEVAKCEAINLYSVTTAQFLRTMSRGKRGHRFPMPRLSTPDKKQVSQTFLKHPSPQCRLDTYFQAALCTTPGLNCDNPKEAYSGNRPRCWFFQ